MQLVDRSLILTGAFALTLQLAAPVMAGGAGGAGGGASCIDTTDVCQVCASEECPAETQACCDAAGCQDVLLCVLDNCPQDPQDINCIAANCSAEVIAAGGPNGPGGLAAKALGTCLATPLQNPPAGVCTDCVDGFNTGGGGPGGAGGNGPGATVTTTTTTGAGGSGGAPSAGGSTPTSSSSTGGNAADPQVVDDGCGCSVVGSPDESSVAWALVLGAFGAVGLRRRRR